MWVLGPARCVKKIWGLDGPPWPMGQRTVSTPVVLPLQTNNLFDTVHYGPYTVQYDTTMTVSKEPLTASGS